MSDAAPENPNPPRRRTATSPLTAVPSVAAERVEAHIDTGSRVNLHNEPTAPLDLRSHISLVPDDPPEAPTPATVSAPDAPAQHSRLPTPGTRIGKYEILREIGRGGMGAVFEARDRELGRRVAIKLLHGKRQPGATARLIREAQATALCQHDHIVVVHEVVDNGSPYSPYMVLEYLSGEPMSQLLRERGKLTPTHAVKLIDPVVRALVHAHHNKLVHRDLKPANIFITKTGTIKVLDFGLAKLVHGEFELVLARGSAVTTAMTLDDIEGFARLDLTQRGTLMGTLSFMSPEQWRGAAEVDHQTDIWAIGIILWLMLTGRHPLAPLKEWALQVIARPEPMPSIRAARPDLPDELADIVDGCLRKRKQDRIASAQALFELLEPLLPGREPRLRADENPYPGLAAFQETDANKFFGRKREIDAAVARLRDTPLMAIVGPSGVGKSSIVRAGLIPGLKSSGEPWETLVMRPGRHPMAALAAMLSRLVNDADNTAITVMADLSHEQAMVDRLSRAPGTAGSVLRSHARKQSARILVFIDQFEELYTLAAPPQERAAFLASLAAIADDATSPLRVVLAIRSDFLDRVVEHAQFISELTQGLVFLGPPSREGLRDALIKPAEMAEFRFESPETVDDMLNHLGHTPGALPLLQFAASQLWATRDRARQLLTVDRYQQMGGIAGALAGHADAVIAAFTAQEQTLVRVLLLRLITSERTRSLVPVSELYKLSPDPKEVQRVIGRLVRSRLLVSQTAAASDDDTAAVELVHESLIHSWPLLGSWLDETQGDTAFLEQLRSAAKQWQAKGYAPGLLWRGEAVVEAQLSRSRYRGELPELERKYLDAVFALAARASRVRRAAILAAFGVLLLLVAAAGIALITIRDAQQETTAQLHRTQAAETTATDANLKLERQNTELATAVAAANRARSDAERAGVDAERARVHADEARLRAETAQRYERRSKVRATAAARAARLAEEDATAAGERLAVLLEQQRQRVKELEQLTRGATILPQVEPRDGE